jgi:O-antigen biosynthesis protein WbqP
MQHPFLGGSMVETSAQQHQQAAAVGTSTFKRIFDFTIALIGIVALSPIILVALLAIRLGSRGSPVFAQLRLGRGEHTFVCYKMRTMYRNAGNLPTHQIAASKITPLGNFLRRTKLDELPQLFNVVRGDMSLVGPRPCLPIQTDLIDARRQTCAFAVLPGITGLAQIAGVDMSDPIKLAKIDGDYVHNRTFAIDMRILISTLTGSGLGVDRVTRLSEQNNQEPLL